MSAQCPLLFRQVDSTITRINTAFIVFGVVLYLMSGWTIVLVVLIIDFLLRLSGKKEYSPIQYFSLSIQRKLHLPAKMEDAGAKRLAAIFGLGFIIAILFSHIFGLHLFVMVFSALYLSCAFLDLFTGYCIACKIYHLFKMIYPKGI